MQRFVLGFIALLFVLIVGVLLYLVFHGRAYVPKRMTARDSVEVSLAIATGRQEDSVLLVEQLRQADSVAYGHSDHHIAGGILWETIRIREMYSQCWDLFDSLRDDEMIAARLTDNDTTWGQEYRALIDDSLRTHLARWDERLGRLESLLERLDRSVDSANVILERAHPLHPPVRIALPLDLELLQPGQTRRSRSRYQ